MYTQVYVLLSYSMGRVSRKKQQKKAHPHYNTFPYVIIIIIIIIIISSSSILKQFKHFFTSS
jgi:uncharacterized membrane protein YadS